MQWITNEFFGVPKIGLKIEERQVDIVPENAA